MNEKQSTSVRVFFSIRLSQTAQHAVIKLLKVLRQKIRNEQIRWTQGNHLHITLRFIDPITPAALDTVNQLVAERLTKLKPFTLEFGDIYAFPPKHPHCIALYVKPSHELALLAAEINKVLSQAGLPPEQRAFLPHLTLARVKRCKFPDLSGAPEMAVPSIMVNGVTLFKSKPTASGSHYTPLQVFQLGASS